MEFEQAINEINRILLKMNIKMNPQDYDGIIVKKLEESNILSDRPHSNQTHIAITGKQMNIFPSVELNGYFTEKYSERNDKLKKYFIFQVPINLSKNNFEYINSLSKGPKIEFSESTIKVFSSIVRSRRGNQSDQMQLSLINQDSPEFILFRKNIVVGNFIVLAKKVKKIEYDLFAIDDSDVIEDGVFLSLNNMFIFKESQTIVRPNQIINDFYGTKNEKATNLLVYGVPGSGKSHYIQNNICSDLSRLERVVFHQDYSNADFVGQIFPIMENDRVSYKFKPGPFPRILKKAIEDPNNHYYLIVEEINRGNAPSIFGDVFQLLDRDDSGTSQFLITNYDVANYVHDDGFKMIGLPSNLSIIATMNTSDQNVFPLDTAFQRRWDMKLIQNDVGKALHAECLILDTQLSWSKFVNVLNEFILQTNNGLTSTEDKRIGAYFIKPSDFKQIRAESVFADKVLKYLWDDVCKFNREILFDSKYRSLEEVINKFIESEGCERFNFFKKQVIEMLFDWQNE